MKLSELSVGEKFKVLKVNSSGEIAKRLADMGFTSGAQGRIVRTALFGDPIQVCMRGCNLSIRRSEAELIEVDVIICEAHKHQRRWRFFGRWQKER